jgi:2-iminobutanoate/2-iminopropanoate deaminase
MNVISTDSAPRPVGPYSQGIRSQGSFIFTSGQIALDPKTGVMVGTTVTEQTQQALANLVAVLAAGGSSLDQVVKTTVFLVDMSQFAEMNAVYQQFFAQDPPPARSCIAAAALPKGALVEIEAIACCSHV